MSRDNDLTYLAFGTPFSIGNNPVNIFGIG